MTEGPWLFWLLLGLSIGIMIMAPVRNKNITDA